MTGKRLYELLTDEWGNAPRYSRIDLAPKGYGSFLLSEGPAWAFLSPVERAAFCRAAARIKGVRR